MSSTSIRCLSRKPWTLLLYSPMSEMVPGTDIAGNAEKKGKETPGSAAIAAQSSGEGLAAVLRSNVI